MDKQTQKELLNIVKNNYEEIALDFCETRRKHLWPELIKLASQVKSGSKVLDVGCGNGRLLQAFKGKNMQYLGVDNSESLIQEAKKLHKNYKFEIGNILDLGKIADYDFDYIFCNAVLHHIPSKKLQIDAVKQLKNKINDKGKIVITVWNLWTNKKFKKLIFKFALLKIFKKNPSTMLGTGKMDFGDILFEGFIKRSKRYYHAFRKRELRKVCRKAGLKVMNCYKDQYNYYIILKKKGV